MVSYDYAFPETCTFGRHGVKAAGSVWASVQNEHSAPGIYVQPDTGFLMVIDHVNARIVSGDASSVTLEIENPTYRDGDIKVLAEK